MQRSERERIFTKLDEMIKYVQELREMLPEEDEYLHDLIKRRACEKTVEVAIESLLDVSAMIVSSQKLGLPSDEENIIDILIENGVLGKDLGETLKDLKGFRNVLIHRYGHINDEMVYHNLSNYLDDFYKFEEAFASYLKKKGSNYQGNMR